MNISELTDVVKAASEAKAKEKVAIRYFIQDVVKEQGLLGKDEFWPELERFVGIVKQFRDVYKRTNWSKQATNEFFRAEIFRDTDNKETLTKCIRFVATYEDKVAKISKSLLRLEEEGSHEFGMGEDSFGDMCDSFPLHGRKAYEALMEDGVVPHKPELGENYIVMNFNSAEEDWVRNCVEDLNKKD